MIGEIAPFITSQPELLSTFYLSHQAGHKKAVAKATLKELKNSTSETFRPSNIKKLGKTALKRAVLTAHLYGDDVAIYGAYVGLRQAIPGNGLLKEAVAMTAAGVMSAGANVGVTYLNSGRPEKFQNTPGIEQDVGRHPSLKERVREKHQGIKKQIGKYAVTLSVGVPLNALQEKFTNKEVWAHSLVYGATSAGLYKAANVSLGMLDSPWAVPALVAGVVGSRYVSTAVDRAAERAVPEPLIENISIPIDANVPEGLRANTPAHND